MSVIMMLRVAGDPDKLEAIAAEQVDLLSGISARAKDRGMIAHRFYGSEGQIMVVDEWPDAESFQQFFEAESAAIGPLMEQIATGEPEITIWRKLDTRDDIGWE